MQPSYIHCDVEVSVAALYEPVPRHKVSHSYQRTHGNEGAAVPPLQALARVHVRRLGAQPPSLSSRGGQCHTPHTHSDLKRRGNTVTGNARHAATAAAPRATSANGRHAPSANARVLLSATMAARELSIAVLGAGCVGTSTALALMEAGFRRVTLIAHRRTPHTLSDGAGALWMPYKCGDTPYSLIRCASVSHSSSVSVDVRAWSLCLLHVAWVCRRDVCVFAGGGVRDVLTYVDAAVTGAGGGRTSRGYATTPS